ncbi:carbamoyl-phosphate synthase L subunit-like protein [Prosthecobacter fusiformis]|uniref:Carbamoyl-phosphate synthase L subunit-like protein n=2 Tax=Prosthecobacter fusiformis TaxID=48464 RepID=A0A4R7RZT1_9BACT|nr:carbamoyl-phosphate synthase L subunit-like protein [Prosthecobacter fusiformis]
MVIGGSYDQLPMIHRARELGCRTLAVDGNPSAPGMEHADEALVIDTSDLDAVTTAARQHQISGICTMATNLGPRTVSHVAAQLGLPAVSCAAAENATDKNAMKAACRAAGVPVAAGETCSSAEEAVSVAQIHGYPLLLKAADASGCRGIEPAFSEEEIHQRFDLAQRESRNALVVVERYYPDARVIGAESLISRGHTHLIFSAEKMVRRHPRISTAGVTVPTDLSKTETEELRDQLSALHKALGLDIGASHVDLVQAEGKWLVIDVGPRLGGGPMIHHLAPSLTGVNMVDFIVRQALGEEPEINSKIISGVGVERFFYSPVEGHLTSIQLPAIPADARMQWRKPVGSHMAPDGPNVDRIGYLSLIASDLATAEQQVAQIASQIHLGVRLTDQTIQSVAPRILSSEITL